MRQRYNLDCEVEIFKGTTALAEEAAKRFVALLLTARQEDSSGEKKFVPRPRTAGSAVAGRVVYDSGGGGRSRSTVALSGGTTPRALYTLLASAPYRSQLDWSRIDFYFGDERGVPPDHPDSNYRLASDSLFRPIGIASGQVHRMRGEMEDLSAAAELYTTELTALVNGELPRFDLLLLGLGSDGHTASLFPNNWALHESVRWVVPILDAPKTPARRLTLTVPVLNDARQVIFLVAGADKASVVREVLRGSAPADHYPAKLIQPSAGRVLWLLDEGAGSLL